MVLLLPPLLVHNGAVQREREQCPKAQYIHNVLVERWLANGWVGSTWRHVDPRRLKLGQVGPSWRQRRVKFPQIGSKLLASPSWLKLAPMWRRLPHIGSKLAQVVGAKLAQVGSKLAQVGPELAPSWHQVGSKLAPNWHQRDPKLLQVGPADMSNTYKNKWKL